MIIIHKIRTLSMVFYT